MTLAYETIRSALAAQPLFEAKSWQLSPEAWPLTPDQVAELEAIGAACLEFHEALETLYLRSVAGKNLLRNKPLLAPWVADYLDRGKPRELVVHARDPKNRGVFPNVLRPDLLLTDEGFVLTELDSVPGGIGLTAFLNRLYAGEIRTEAAGRQLANPNLETQSKLETRNSEAGVKSASVAERLPVPPGSESASATPGQTRNPEPETRNPEPGTRNPKPGAVLGADDAMIRGFYDSLAALRPEAANPVIALVVSDEAATYRPEMQWLELQLQLMGKRVYCLRPDQVFPLGSGLFFDIEGNPEKIDIIYRFFELFDLANIRTAPFFFEAWKAGEVAIAPPMRPFQEEKLSLALFHHHRLQEFWAEALSRRTLERLRQLIPPTWVLDAATLPPGAVLDGPHIGGRPLHDWRDLAGASQKERDLIIKISGYHETAWGARSVVLGSDCSRDEWQFGLDRALELAPTNLHVLQAYKKPKRVQHPVYRKPEQDDAPAVAVTEAGRLRLCPYYFVVEGRARLSGALATFCPPDKKIIHGMQDAALLPCRVTV
jgi:hypothetical protein